MPPPRQTFIIRDDRGHCHTVIAHSLRGAVKLWSARNARYTGYVDAKVRGAGDWQHFKIS